MSRSEGRFRLPGVGIHLHVPRTHTASRARKAGPGVLESG